MNEITREMARAKLPRIILVNFGGAALLLALLTWLNSNAPLPVEPSPEEQATRDANFELIFPWLLGFVAVVGPCALALVF